MTAIIATYWAIPTFLIKDRFSEQYVWFDEHNHVHLTDNLHEAYTLNHDNMRQAALNRIFSYYSKKIPDKLELYQVQDGIVNGKNFAIFNDSQETEQDIAPFRARHPFHFKWKIAELIVMSPNESYWFEFVKG